MILAVHWCVTLFISSVMAEAVPVQECLPISMDSEQDDPNLEIVDEQTLPSLDEAAIVPEKIDPLAYTKTGDFTSEIYKIFIDNMYPSSFHRESSKTFSSRS